MFDGIWPLAMKSWACNRPYKKNKETSDKYSGLDKIVKRREFHPLILLWSIRLHVYISTSIQATMYGQLLLVGETDIKKLMIVNDQ